MHTYLFVGENVEAQIQSFVKERQAQSIVFQVEKIAEARELITFTQFGFSTPQVIVVPNFDRTTLDAQNALLKLLEEGKPQTTFLLTAQNTGSIVETVLSRSDVTYLSAKQSSESTFHNLPVGEKLTQTVKIKDRDKAREFLSNLVRSLPSDKVSPVLTAKEAIERNGILQLHLTQMVIEMSK